MKKLLLLLLTFVAVFSLVACNKKTEEEKTPAKEKTEEHTHMFEGEWYSDDTFHWQKCECGETSEKGIHEFEEQNIEEVNEQRVLKCKVCSKEVILEDTKTEHTRI